MKVTSRHLHLDPLGGIAGDMFSAAMLDLMPAMEAKALAAGQALLGDKVTTEILRDPVDGFAGRRLKVVCESGAHHRRLPDVLSMIDRCDVLPDRARAIATGIFTKLAEAEAEVHGKPLESIHFHEVGAADSILDIALAGLLIDAAGAESWSVGALPLGGGTVKTEHGLMPVPAPATTLLLRGFDIHDDGVGGERVTPTGAAILAYLRDRMISIRPSGAIGRTGMGFGTRKLPAMPNMLRVLEIQGGDEANDVVAVIEFELDDQTAEELACALDILRALGGVRDIVQTPCFGKKGRMVAAIRVLCEPSAREPVRDAIFSQTTTLGVREQIVTRHVLERWSEERGGVRVKGAMRGDRASRKAEFDDLARNAHDHESRKALRRKVEDDE
ncbi:MAG: LarC family nickel insertion protein [Hyphomicrobiales bacterium]|nr:LarC family nickel insertion protein [Hyphomicrobiales bacterium]